MPKGGEYMAQVGNLFVKIGLNMNEFETGMRNLNKSIRDTERQFKGITSISKRMQSLGKTLTTHVTLPVIGLGAAATKSSIDLESAFAGVRKTVDATEEEFAALRKGFDDMARNEVPIAVEELYGLGEAAGQLGIQTNAILEFSDTMAKLGVATNMSSNEAATALARLANITQMPQDQFDRLGSTVVALGNNLATTESEIVEMGLRLAGAGKQVGMTEAQVLSFAGSLSSVGIEAQAGGSAFSKLMVNIQLAVEKGGKKLDEFAKVAGMSASQFQQAFKEDAAGAITEFIQGLSTTEERGMSAIAVLDEMGITEVRMRDALLRAAGASDVFTGALELGTKAWEENNALNKEAEQRFNTTASQLQFLSNNMKILGDSFGQILLPQVNELVQRLIVLTQRFSELDEDTKKTIVNVGLFAAAAGPLLILVGKLGLGFVSLAKAKTLFTGKLIAGTAATQGAAVATTTLSGSLAALAGKIGLVVGALYLFKVALDDSKKGQDSLGASAGMLGYNMQNLQRDIDNVKYSLSEEGKARREAQASVNAYTDSVETQRLKNQQAIQQHDTIKKQQQEQIGILGDMENLMNDLTNGITQNTGALAANANEMESAAEAAKKLEQQLKLVYNAYRKVDAAPSSIVSKYMADYINRTGDVSVAFGGKPKFAAGGIIRRPVGMIDLATGEPVGMAGEAGDEAIVPMGRGGGQGGTAINYDSLGRAIARYVKPSITMNNTFKSPEPINPSIAKRKQEQLSRQLAMEWGV